MSIGERVSGLGRQAGVAGQRWTVRDSRGPRGGGRWGEPCWGGRRHSTAFLVFWEVELEMITLQRQFITKYFYIFRLI